MRVLIVARLAPLDQAAAIDRLWRFMATAPQASRRYRERIGELQGVFERAAADLSALFGPRADRSGGGRAGRGDYCQSLRWKAWLLGLLEAAPKPIAEDALRFMAETLSI